MTSGAYCAVKNCKNQKTMKEISFFKLPTDAKRREDWLYMIGRPDLLQKPDLKPECHFVCHVHFEEFMMIRKPLLKHNAIPTRNIPTVSNVNNVVQIPTTKEDKSTQTRKKFYKDLVNCKRTEVTNQGEMQKDLKGDPGSKKAKKRKLKDKIGEKQQKIKKLTAEVEELKQKLHLAKVTTMMICELVGNKTPNNETATPTSTSICNKTKPENIVVEVEIKHEKGDD